MGVEESLPGPPPSRVMSFGRLFNCAPKGMELNGEEASEPVPLPARSAGDPFDGRVPGTGAAVQTFSGGFFVCAHATPGSRQMASIAAIKRMGSSSLLNRNATSTSKLSTNSRLVHPPGVKRGREGLRTAMGGMER